MNNQPTNRKLIVTLITVTTIVTTFLLFSFDSLPAGFHKDAPIRISPGKKQGTTQVVTVAVDFDRVNSKIQSTLEVEFPSDKMDNTNCDELPNTASCIEEHAENMTKAWTMPTTGLSGFEELIELSFECEQQGEITVMIKPLPRNNNNEQATICQNEPAQMKRLSKMVVGVILLLSLHQSKMRHRQSA